MIRPPWKVLRDPKWQSPNLSSRNAHARLITQLQSSLPDASEAYNQCTMLERWGFEIDQEISLLRSQR